MATFELNFWTNDNETKRECQLIVDGLLQSTKFHEIARTTRDRLWSFLKKFLEIQVDPKHALRVFKELQSIFNDNSLDDVTYLLSSLENIVALALISFRSSGEASTGFTESEIKHGAVSEDQVIEKLGNTTQQYVAVHCFLKNRLQIKAIPTADDHRQPDVVDQKRSEHQQMKSCRRRDAPKGSDSKYSFCAFTRVPDGQGMHLIPYDVAAAKEWTLTFWLFIALMLGEKMFEDIWKICGGQRCCNGRNICFASSGIHKRFDPLELSLQPCEGVTEDGEDCEDDGFRKLRFNLRYYTDNIQGMDSYLSSYNFLPDHPVVSDMMVEYRGRWSYKDSGTSIPLPHPLLFGVRDFVCRCYSLFKTEAEFRKKDNRFIDWRDPHLKDWSQVAGDSRGSTTTKLSTSQSGSALDSVEMKKNRKGLQPGSRNHVRTLLNPRRATGSEPSRQSET
ncbi:MAG: hypothetical protein M1820_010235 [Bogoriella megaspora]|nr:MAG: hypothetical protein M1820_010235 [Bogoriella megaspora]